MMNSTTQSPQIKPPHGSIPIINKILKATAILMFWVAVWQVIYLLVGMEVIIPSPAGTALRILQLGATAQFWIITGASVGRIMLGYLCGIAIGLLLAATTAASDILYALFRPIISVARATPVASLTVIVVVWVTNRSVPLFIVGLMVFPIIWGNTYEGIKNTDKKLLQMTKSFSVGLFSRLAYVYIPSVYPFFISGASAALGLSWKAGIAAEILGSTQGSVGQQLNTAKVELDSQGKFAWTVVVIVLSVVFERVIVSLLKKTTVHIPLRAKPAANVSLQEGYIRASGIYKSYGTAQVLDNVSAIVKSGSVTALVGRSGAGKTTLLNIFAGLERPDSGEVERRGGVAYLFQENRLLPWLTVSENILLVNRGANTEGLLELVSLSGCGDMLPAELSGGMKRRAAIARTLAAHGSVVLLDEPFTGLDEALKEQCAERVFKYLSDRAVVLVTHDSADVRRFADSVTDI